jgi:hypothetical protein
MIDCSATKQQFVDDVRSNAIADIKENYNEIVRNESIVLLPCAYLLNMKSGESDNTPKVQGFGVPSTCSGRRKAYSLQPVNLVQMR